MAKAKRSTAPEVIASLRAGDVVKVTSTVQIDRIIGNDVVGHDVAEKGTQYTFENPGRITRAGTLTVEVVSRAPRSKADYSPGDELTADEIRAVQWKRGTIIHYDAVYMTAKNGLVLREDGNWHCLSNETGAATRGSYGKFEDLRGSFILDYIAP